MTRPLAVVGNVNVDLIMGPISAWPLAGTEVIADHDQLRPGGAAAYAALTWQALGAEFQVAANVGNDAFGQWLAGSFPNHSSQWPRQATSTTVSVGITHPDGERTFFTTRGHLPELSWPAVREALDEDMVRGGLLLLSGSYLTDKLTHDYDLLFDWAVANDISVALDPGWPSGGWSEHLIAQTKDWVSRSTYLLINEVEAKHLTGSSSIHLSLEHLQQILPRNGLAVIKAGPLGAFARNATGEVLHCKAPEVNVIDTIGAGDVFNANFLYALAQGEDVYPALSFGANAASLAISTSPRQYAPAPVNMKRSA